MSTCECGKDMFFHGKCITGKLISIMETGSLFSILDIQAGFDEISKILCSFQKENLANDMNLILNLIDCLGLQAKSSSQEC